VHITAGYQPANDDKFMQTVHKVSRRACHDWK